MSAASIVVRPMPLTAYLAAIVSAGGSDAREAELTARNLVLANLSGHDSHGVGMIPQYVKFLKAGGLIANQHAKLTGEFGSMLMIDGQRGYGQVIGHEAMLLGIARARRDGLALVALQNEKDMAPGTLIDPTGSPTNDPRVMFERDAAGKLGAILPFGEHKGYGLALVCEILAGALTGGAHGGDDGGGDCGARGPRGPRAARLRRVPAALHPPGRV